MIVCLLFLLFFSKVNCCISPPLSVTNLFASASIDTTVRKDQTAQNLHLSPGYKNQELHKKTHQTAPTRELASMKVA